MKRFTMLLAAGIVASLALAGCASAPQLTPAQLAAALCPPTNNAITLFSTFNATLKPTLPVAAQVNAALTKYKPVVNAVCAAGATVTATNVQALIDQGIPAVASIAAVLPLPPETQALVQAGFAAAELTTNLVGQYEASLAAAKASAAASAVPAAPAPVAASSQ